MIILYFGVIGQWVEKGDRLAAGRCPGNVLLDRTIIFDTDTPSDFKDIRADIARAPPIAQI
jgi:hypothetical protein